MSKLRSNNFTNFTPLLSDAFSQEECFLLGDILYVEVGLWGAVYSAVC